MSVSSCTSGSSAGLVGDAWKGEPHAEADAGDHRGAECGWLDTLLLFAEGLRGELSKVCLTGVIESRVAQREGGLLLACPGNFARDLLWDVTVLLRSALLPAIGDCGPLRQEPLLSTLDALGLRETWHSLMRLPWLRLLEGDAATRCLDLDRLPMLPLCIILSSL